MERQVLLVSLFLPSVFLNAMSKPFPAEVRQLRQLLHKKVLLWAETESPIALFDVPPVTIGDVGVREHATLPLPETSQEKVFPHMQWWKAQQLNAITTPMLGCVFEGEAQYKAHRPPGEKGGQWILTLKAGTLFTIAPGMPFSDGSKVAWEGADLQKSYSRAFLMQLRPEGVIYHSFTSDKGKLWLHPYIFLYNFEVLLLGERLQEEQRREHASPPLIYLYWQMIFRLLIRSIDEGDFALLRWESGVFGADEKQSPSSKLTNKTTLEVAVQYINNHLKKSDLNVQAIATHAGISERHLARLFRQVLGVSPYAYVQQKRLERACALLRHSRLSIGQIGNYCGFPRLSHFTIWFTRRMKQSPQKYRQEKYLADM